ncbi:MAG: L-aspartate oxidase [Oscillospiraceae bacterium]|nr:L-aspartate oxidase [Oscillospiraceae bacterium]
MRYAVSNQIKFAEPLDFDVVVVGTGLAGLYTALHIDPAYSCCLLTKERTDVSCSWLAQGGIAAAMSDDDTPDLHSEDTLLAGAGYCDLNAVQVLVDEGPDDIRTLVEMGVPFDQDELGGLRNTREGGHRRRRVLHAGGDATGRETVKALSARADRRENVTLMGRTFLVDVLLDDTGTVCGALIHSKGAYRVIRTRHLVIATGGIGQVYKTSTNPEVATGDGIAAAVRAGAKLADMEFVQFHPTGLWQENQTGQAFLVSETLRGEGGILKNADGVAFMEGVHELKDLAPRDIVARAIHHEMTRTGAEHVYLDIRHRGRDFLEPRFPTIWEHCAKAGIDLSEDLIPVLPVQHYLIGGIATDLHGRTNVPGLYACGEAASTGVHGANRLAANSMLECLVFGRRVAAAVNESLPTKTQDAKDSSSCEPSIPARPVFAIDESALRLRVQELMHTRGAVVRSQAGLAAALKEIRAIRQQLEQGFDDRRVYIELLNIVTIAEAILEAALDRTESVGAHYRRD